MPSGSTAGPSSKGSSQHKIKCIAPPDPIPKVPSAVALSSASWQLVLLSMQACDDESAEWEVRIRRGGDEVRAMLQPTAVTTNATATSLNLVGVRCPPDATKGDGIASGCSFALRMRDPYTNTTSPWSPDSAVQTSKPIDAVPSGAARVEVHFAATDPVWPRWEGSAAQRLQRFASSQMAVSERSVRMVERFADGEFAVLDLVPLELGLTHMLERLLPGLPRQPSQDGFGVQEVHRILPFGTLETLFTAADGVSEAYATTASEDSPSFDSLPIAVAFSGVLCLFLARSWQEQQRQYAHAGAGKRDRKLRQAPDRRIMADDDDDDEDSDVAGNAPVATQVSVRFAPSCGEEMELLLPTAGINDPNDLRTTIWQRGDALMPRGLPAESKLCITFVDAKASERPLTSATLVAQVFEAGRINVSCNTCTSEGGTDNKEAEVEISKEEEVVQAVHQRPPSPEPMPPSPVAKPISSFISDGAGLDMDMSSAPIIKPPPKRASGSGDGSGRGLHNDMADDEEAAMRINKPTGPPPTRTWEQGWEEASPKGLTPFETVFTKAAPGAHILPQSALMQDDELMPPTPKKSPKFSYPLD